MNTTEEITKQINTAIAAHGMWKTRLKNAIDTQSSEFDVAFVKSPANCDFGKWLNKEKINLQHHPDFAKVLDIHAQVHAETARIMELALTGKKDEALKAIAAGSIFANQSVLLTKTMMHWKSSLS